MASGKKRALALCAAALFTLPFAALAQTGAGSAARYAEQQLHQKFLRADKDKDGFLTQAEAKAGNMPTTAEHFAEIDTTQRGKVSEKEIQQFLLKRAVDKSNAASGH
jgi:hypothetical protein